MSDLPDRFRAGVLDPAADPLVIVPVGDGLAVVVEGEAARFPRRSDLRSDASGELGEQGVLGELGVLGTLDDDAYVSPRAPVAPGVLEANGLTVRGLRSLFGAFSRDRFAIAGLAIQLAHFEAVSRHCSQCGRALERRELGAARFGVKVCATCAREVYPHVSPCAIVLVTRGDELLLTRKSIFPNGFYGLVAGFLEPAETLETCARREVLEETGVAIDDVRYFGSQPWPFPSQVMVGFTARWVSGEVVVDTTELEDARFFHRDAMPNLPPPLSIARRMIDAWLASKG